MLSTEGDKNLTKYGRRHNIMLTCINGGEVSTNANKGTDLKFGKKAIRKTKLNDAENKDKVAPAKNVTDKVNPADAESGDSKSVDAKSPLDSLSLDDGTDMAKIFEQLNSDGGFGGIDGMGELISNLTKADWDSIAKPDLGLGSDDLSKALEEMEEPDFDEESLERLQKMFQPFMAKEGSEDFDEEAAESIMKFTEDPSFENLQNLPSKFMQDVFKLTEELSQEDNQALFDPIIQKLPNDNLREMFENGFDNLVELNKLVKAQKIEEGSKDKDDDADSGIASDSSANDSDDTDDDNSTGLIHSGRRSSIAANEEAGDDNNGEDENAEALKLLNC